MLVVVPTDTFLYNIHTHNFMQQRKLKEYFNPEKYTIWNEHLCKIKFCIGHKTDDGVLWKEILDDKSRQVCLHGGGSTVITMVIPEIIGKYIFIYGLLFAIIVMIFVAQML